MKDNKMSNADYLIWLKKEAKQFERTKNTFKMQSEFYRLMYAYALQIENLEAFLNNQNNDR